MLYLEHTSNNEVFGEAPTVIRDSFVVWSVSILVDCMWATITVNDGLFTVLYLKGYLFMLTIFKFMIRLEVLVLVQNMTFLTELGK